MNLLNNDPEILGRLVDTAEAERNRRLDIAEERMQVAMGAMADQGRVSRETPENLGFALFSILIPSMVTSSPVASVTSDGDSWERLQAAALGAAGTQMMQKQRVHEALEPAAWDFLMGLYSAAFIEKPRAKMREITKEEREVMEGRLHAPFEDVGGDPDDVMSPQGSPTPNVQIPPRWATLKRVHPRMCGFDCAHKSLSEARFTWYDVVTSRQLLEDRALENDDWDIDAVRALDCHGEPDRDEVAYRVIYIPGGVLDDVKPTPNQPGIIITIGRTRTGDGKNVGTAIALREPYYWEGHPGGPIVFGGQYTTGEDPFGLTLLTANAEALQQLDSVSFAVHQKIRKHKVNYAYDASIQAEAEELKQAQDSEWVAVPALRDGRVLERIETGELSPAEVNELREAQMTAQRALGIDDAARGLASSDATATAVSVAANTTRTKVQYILDRWERFVRECMERLLWEIAHDDTVAIRLDERGRIDVWRQQLQQAVDAGQLDARGLEVMVQLQAANPLVIQGGDFANPENELDWHSLNIRVEPGSLDGSLGEQRMQRELLWNQSLVQLGQAAATQPHIDWHRRVQQTAESFGFSDGDTIMSRQTLEQMLQMQMAQGYMGDATLESQSPDAQRAGATLRESSGGARSPSGVDPGTFQMTE